MKNIPTKKIGHQKLLEIESLEFYSRYLYAGTSLLVTDVGDGISVIGVTEILILVIFLEEWEKWASKWVHSDSEIMNNAFLAYFLFTISPLFPFHAR